MTFVVSLTHARWQHSHITRHLDPRHQLCETFQVNLWCENVFLVVCASIFENCTNLLTCFTLVGVVSSDVSRSSRTTYFPPCCSIFSQSHVFFQGCPCSFLDVINVLHPRTPPSSFPDIIPRMQVFTRLHLLFLHACPKKAIFLLIIWY